MSTYNSVSIYLSDVTQPLNDDDNDARVRFRKQDSRLWRAGLPLWYDARDAQYRGSLVGLEQGATYVIEVTLDDGTKRAVEATTWTEDVPVAKVVTLPASSNATLTITESGTADGYIVYQPANGRDAVIDVAKNADFNVVVNASYIIVRGLTLRGARHSGVVLGPNASQNTADIHHVIIEHNDISDWGSMDPACATKATKFGANLHSGVYSYSRKLRAITVQRNKLHHPTWDANSWDEEVCNGSTKHPLGPQGVSFRQAQGNIVVRYNDIYSDADHFFNDAMGELQNFSDGGFPNKDSDINNNFIRNCWDDGIESEGANKNVRIWANYIDLTYVKIAIASTSQGPIYLFRNISYTSKAGPQKTYGQGFIKSRNNAGGEFGSGRVYLFNNVSLTPREGDGAGTSNFLNEFSEAEAITNYRSLNNVLNVGTASSYSIRDSYGTTNRWDYDLLVGNTAFSGKPVQQEVHGVRGRPVFAEGWGLDTATHIGNFALDETSPGYDAGTVIPNFSEGYQGAAPDMGAHEAGLPPMEFGVDAYLNG